MSKLGEMITNDINSRESLNRAVVTKSFIFNYIGMSTPVIRIEPPTERWYQTDVSATDSLIWGHQTYGEWGAYNWGSSISGAVTSHLYTFNTNNDFREHFRDSEFIDASNTTATVDTSNYLTSFTASEVVTSDKIHYTEKGILSAKPSFDYEGSLLIELSNDDGSSWNTVTNNTLFNFTSLAAGGVFPFTFPLTFSSVKALKWRATENNASNASLTRVRVTYTLEE